MNRYLAFFAISIMVAAFHLSAAPVSPQRIERVETILRVDTIHRTDTVVTTEVIRRADVIKRTETIIRSDSVISGSDSGYSSDILSSFPQKPVVVRDTVWVNMPDSAVIANGSIAHPEGGELMWIPDSLKSRVGQLFNGEHLDFNLSSPEPVEDWVTFRGDTIPTMLRERNLGRFDRGLSNHLFLPKGIWTFGVTASYGEFSTSDLEILDLVSDIDFSGHLFSIRPYFSYMIANNMSVGMRIGYTSGKARIDSFKVDIDEDMNFNLHDIMYRSESYTAAVTFNQYYGIARRGRFGIFNEVELAFSSGNSDFHRPYNGEPRITHTTTMAAAINFSPGLSVFIMDPVSFNISFGVFGFQLRNDKQTVNGEKMGSRFTSSANFRFNIFNINFGIAVNI
ncbi:MAG: hypothetical protein K2K58_11285 [Muribaculaceae bacterium]|nr:hypothetical protein [Muribaculaceae bacterium]